MSSAFFAVINVLSVTITFPLSPKISQRAILLTILLASFLA
jgi:hypothetical protein